ncbi:MAG: polysaccharide biosynthesis protein [Opitutia bacterium]
MAQPPVSRLQRAAFFAALYGALAFLSLWFAYELRFTGSAVRLDGDRLFEEAFLQNQRPAALLWAVPLKVALLGLAGQFSGVFYYFRLHDALRMCVALFVSAALTIAVAELAATVSAGSALALPRGVVLIDFNLSLVLFVGFRVAIRSLRERFWTKDPVRVGAVERIAVIGAGRSGEQLVADLLSRRGHGLEPVCFLDEDPSKHGLLIHGVRVVGGDALVPHLGERYGVTEVILALPSTSARRVRELSGAAAAAGLRVLVVPSLAELAGGRIRATDLRPVSVEDLLGREPARLDDAAIDAMVLGRTVMVTGAGGSIGLEIARQAAARGPARLVLVDRCEVLLFQAEQELLAGPGASAVVAEVADVTDAARMRDLFARHRPSLVLHAAAHKHVPLMESQPGEALSNNVLGTAVVAGLASEHAVERFVLISSDKAIRPTNVMGASKRLAELAVQSMQGRPGNRTRFVAVRFGNVLGSSGSVIPIFRRQIAAGGPVTVTHPEVRRYFLTIPEAVGLVLQSAVLAEGGDILVLEMGEPLRILDVARQLIELSGFRPDVDIEIRITGLRPGEKLVEELHHEDEKHRPTAHPRVTRLVSAAPPHADLPGLLARVEALVPAEPDACKRGVQALVPEYEPRLG